MANKIEKATKYIPLLDEVYKKASLTSDLDGAAELAREGANAGEMVIPMISMDGLADYDRNEGYVGGDIELTNETVACNFDRGRMFQVDNVDNEETAGVAFGRLAGAFIREKVVPEIDAFRFATYASTEGISSATADLTTGAAVLAAIRAADTTMDNDEVPEEGRILYITSTLLGLVEDLDTTKSKKVLEKHKIKVVPPSRFYTAIKQKNGTSEGEKVGGYAKAENGKNINFMLIHPSAMIQFPRHVAPKVIPPELNQKGDGYLFGYRNVGIADVYKNKLAGIYCHMATT